MNIIQPCLFETGSANTSEPSGDTGARHISLCEPVTPEVAHKIVLKLLSYEASLPGEPIHLYIYSPGGCIASGLAVIDVMHHVTAPVFTYTIGYAASMAAVILACGQPGHRYILPHSRVMIHRATAAAAGTLDNLRSTLAHQSALAKEAETLLAKATGKSAREIRRASGVDNWMKATTARAFGLVDHVLAPAPAKSGLAYHQQ